MNIGQLVAVVSDALGADAAPMARQLVRDRFLTDWASQSSPWEAAMIVGAMLGARDPGAAGDVVVRLTGLSVFSASTIGRSGTTDLRDGWTATPIDMLEALLEATNQVDVKLFQAEVGGGYVSLLLDGDPALCVVYSDSGEHSTKLRQSHAISTDVFQKIRAAFARSAVSIAEAVHETPGAWGVWLPSGGLVH